VRSVQDQLAAVLAAVGPVAPLDVVLADAVGCVLAQDVVAPRDLPALALASCDGYAVAAHETAGRATADGTHGAVLPVAHDVLPGRGGPVRLAPGQAVRIASGAPVPLGADAVVPLEHTDRGTARVELQRTAVAGEHVRTSGSQAHQGEIVLEAGVRLGARQLALAASLGLSRLPVHPSPRVVIVSVGDELVEPGTSRADGVVFEANGHALEAAVRDAGATPVRVGIQPDDRARLREAFEDQLVRADLLLVTGGLSELAHDTVKDVLAPLGAVRFDQVAMTPGRRSGFGVVGVELGRDRDVPVFALQGDPVAALVQFEVFVRPALRQVAGQAEVFRPSVAARATAGWPSPPGLRQFVPATVLGSPEEGYRVTPVGVVGAPGVRSLAAANALAVVGEQDRAVQAGQVVHCLVLEG
jgi:molybdopterin molybdotransferase